jgi:hypothetical protein
MPAIPRPVPSNASASGSGTPFGGGAGAVPEPQMPIRPMPAAGDVEFRCAKDVDRHVNAVDAVGELVDLGVGG